MCLPGCCPRQPFAPPYRAVRRLAFVAAMLPVPALCQTTLPAGSGAALEEIIVTARKIEEDVFSVPMSVQVLSGDFVDATDPSSLFELQMDVPGLVVTSLGFYGAAIALRGVTDVGGRSLSIAPHMNGVYLGSSGLALARMFDVERVEVLKGPQGTLYGRNATGGAIDVVTRRPEPEFSASIEGALGSFDTVRIRSHVNVPSDKFAVRLALAGADGDGFVRNSADGRKFAEEDYVGFRGSVRISPSERLTLDAMAQRVDDDGASNELWLPRKDNLVDPGDVRLATVTIENPFLSMTNDVASFEVTYELADLELQSVTGYARNVTNGLDQCDGVDRLQGCLRGVRPDRYEQWSQELRVRSAAGSPLDWLAGLQYVDSEVLDNFHLRIMDQQINDYSATTEETAAALYGQATRRLNEQWSITGGLRFSEESDLVASSGTGLADSPTVETGDGSWNNTSWRLSLERVLAQRGLFYASLATGFKGGGITSERLPSGELAGFDPEELTALEVGVNLRLPERRWTLRASSFIYDFEDMQVQTLVILDNDVVSLIDNAAEAQIYGLDLSAAVQPTDRVTVTASTVWMPKRDFVEYTSAVTGDTLSGNSVNRAPELSASLSVAFRAPIGGLGELSVLADYDYRSEYFFTRTNIPEEAQVAFGLLNLFLRLEPTNASWYAFASARNVLDTDYFNQVFLQSSVGPPANYELGFGLRF